jgi:hypothetical protein
MNGMVRALAGLLPLVAGCVSQAKYEAALSEAGAKSELIRQLTVSNAEMEAEHIGLMEELGSLRAQLEARRKELATIAAEAGNMAASMEQLEQALRELEDRRMKSEANLAAFRDLVNRFRALIDAGTLKVKVIDGRMVVQLATDILFAPGTGEQPPDRDRSLWCVGRSAASLTGSSQLAQRAVPLPLPLPLPLPVRPRRKSRAGGGSRSRWDG